MTGSEVLEAQRLLGKHSFVIEADGVFGYKMKKAVGFFQTMKGLTPSGEVDAETWEALLEGE